MPKIHEVDSLGAFCARLGELGEKYGLSSIYSVDSAKNWAKETTGINTQYFRAKKLTWITDSHASALAVGLASLIPELGEIDLVWGDGKNRYVRSSTLRQKRLADLLKKIEGALEARAVAATALDDPIWRRVARPDLENAVREKLDQYGLAAITGMSGMGKTWLANRVFDTEPGKKYRLGAPIPDENGLLGGDAFLALAGDLFRIVKGHCVSASFSAQGTQRRRMIDEHLGSLNAEVVRLYGDRNRIKLDPSDDLESQSRDLIERLEQVLSVSAKASARALAILGMLAERIRAPRLEKALILIDDLWRDAPDGEMVRLIVGTLGPDGVSAPATHERPWRLLITSQDRKAATGFSGEPKAERIVELDAAETDRLGFGRSVVVAWGAPAASYSSQALADADIDAFRERTFAPSAPRASEISGVVETVGGHPLALAALAAQWRSENYADDFWRRAVFHLAREEPDRDWTESSPLEEAAARGHANPRHRKVLRALRFALTQLAEEDRTRFQDLLVQRRGSGPIRRALFLYWWPRAGRATTGLAKAFEGFAQLSLLQREGPALRLHDLMRLALQEDAQADGLYLSARHRNLLEAAGLLNGVDLTLDDAADFVWPRVPGEDSPLCRLHLRLRPAPDGAAATEQERESVSAYMLDELIHHLNGVGEDQRAPLRRVLLSSFPYLQAQLDAVDAPDGQSL